MTHSAEQSQKEAERGATLHREFVGMLFALAIAEVAVRCGEIVNHELHIGAKLPALSHLFLAATVIATSWVGWGWSAHSLSNVRHVFTKDFLELATDVWLVAVYFFIVQGADKIIELNGARVLQAGVAIEARWIAIMFWTYVGWDLLTKWGESQVLCQRAWASVACAALATLTYCLLSDVQGRFPVVMGDVALVFLVLLFRAMKIHNLRDHNRKTVVGSLGLALGWLVALVLARYSV